jgi:hypothetical protein
MKKLLLTVILTLGSFMTLPAFAWPEVDHMNMCGPATRVVRAYKGDSQGFVQRDRYIAKRGNAYYYRTNCPNIKAPLTKVASKQSKTVYKKARQIRKTGKAKKIIKKLRHSGYKSTYDEHADCARVDRVNGYGRPVRVVRRR